MSGDWEDESTALINEAKKKKSDAKIFKTNTITKYLRAIDDLSKQQMDLLKEQNEGNKQFFANMTTRNLEGRTWKRFFLKLGKAMIFNNSGN